MWLTCHGHPSALPAVRLPPLSLRLPPPAVRLPPFRLPPSAVRLPPFRLRPSPPPVRSVRSIRSVRPSPSVRPRPSPSVPVRPCSVSLADRLSVGSFLSLVCPPPAVQLHDRRGVGLAYVSRRLVFCSLVLGRSPGSRRVQCCFRFFSLFYLAYVRHITLMVHDRAFSPDSEAPLAIVVV